MKHPCTYLLASKRHGTLYLGVTSHLIQRISTHKQKGIQGFSSKYNITTLVYYESHATMPDAIRREKQIKKWKRAWKIRLIEEMNPNWEDLYYSLI